MKGFPISKIKLNTLQKVTHYLTEELPLLTRKEGFDGPSMFARSKRLLGQLNNPQNAHKTIHVAGTSGKGTVCYMIDAILRAHNKRSGLLVSPHVYDIRERVQINNQYAPEKRYIEAANEVIHHAQSMGSLGDAPSYYEVMAAIGFLLTAEKRLDYVVVETGIGGRYDLSNTIYDLRKYCVLTQIGLDHTRILGTTYEQIAAEKAEIMYRHAPVTALKQRNIVNRVFTTAAKEYEASISWVERTGNYQVDDLLLSLDATKNIADRDGWMFDEERATKAAQEVYIPGRFEKRNYNDHAVILDGAHNPQKLTALAGRLESESISPVTVILALSDHNDFLHSLQALKLISKRLLICEFFLENASIPRHAIDANIIAKTARELGFLNVEVIPRPLLALTKAIEFPETIVVTGSFYLLGEIDRAFS